MEILRGRARKHSLKILINDKILFHDMMSYYGLPVPKILFVFKNDSFFINNRDVTDEEIDRALCSRTDTRIFIKLPSEGAARGVFIMTKKDDGYIFNDKKVTAQSLRSFFKGETLFFEEQIEQEPVLKSFNPDTINTIRVLTKNVGGKKEIVMAAARFGRKGQYVDNMCAGGIAVRIDIKTGALGSYGERRFESKRYTVHPDSEIPFKGVVIPQWEEIKKVVYETLSCFPPYRSLGFDIATTPNGLVVLEINTGAGVNLAQVGGEYGIADSFKMGKNGRYS